MVLFSMIQGCSKTTASSAHREAAAVSFTKLVASSRSMWRDMPLRVRFGRLTPPDNLNVNVLSKSDPDERSDRKLEFSTKEGVDGQRA
jgi:hypothetical protein